MLEPQGHRTNLTALNFEALLDTKEVVINLALRATLAALEHGMSSPLFVLGFVLVLAVVIATGRILERLDRAARERQAMMDAIAHLEAHVTWLTGNSPLTDAQRDGLRRAVERQIDFRKFG